MSMKEEEEGRGCADYEGLVEVLRCERSFLGKYLRIDEDQGRGRQGRQNQKIRVK